MTTSHVVSFLLPIAELAAAAWLRSRINPRTYPALMAYLVTESIWHTAAIAIYQWATRYGMPFRMAVRVWVTIEVFRLASVYLSRRRLAAVLLTASGISATAATAMAAVIHLSPWQSAMAFRQYAHLILAAFLWALCLGAWPRLRIVSRDRSAHRWGITVWMTLLAISGTFVKGGLGYTVFSYSAATWVAVNVLTYGALTVTVIGMTLAMGWRRERKTAAQAVRKPMGRATVAMAERVA